MNIDVCILAYSKTQAMWDMTQRCIDSLHKSETEYNFNIMVMDSKNQESIYKESKNTEYFVPVHNGEFVFMGGRYPAPVGVKDKSILKLTNIYGKWDTAWHNNSSFPISIKNIPVTESREFAGAKTYYLPGPFNYNKSINYCIDNSSSPYFLVSNNDVFYRVGWFSSMLKVKGWDSASGWDDHDLNHKHMKGVIEAGYGMEYHVRAHAIISTRNAINKIGHFDETFDFYYQDNDYIETLKKLGLKHFHIGTAHIDHVHHGTTSTYGSKWERDKFIEGKNKFIAKWGEM